MRITELYRHPADIVNERNRILSIVDECLREQDWNTIDQIAEIFSNIKYRDYSEGLKVGIPFSTDTEQLNKVLSIISAQGDELVTKRLLKRILELNNG